MVLRLFSCYLISCQLLKWKSISFQLKLLFYWVRSLSKSGVKTLKASLIKQLLKIDDTLLEDVQKI